jgi:hypothetical protein
MTEGAFFLLQDLLVFLFLIWKFTTSDSSDGVVTREAGEAKWRAIPKISAETLAEGEYLTAISTGSATNAENNVFKNAGVGALSFLERINHTFSYLVQIFQIFSNSTGTPNSGLCKSTHVLQFSF